MVYKMSNIKQIHCGTDFQLLLLVSKSKKEILGSPPPCGPTTKGRMQKVEVIRMEFSRG